MKWQKQLDNLARIDYVKDGVVMSDIEILITSLLKQQKEICATIAKDCNDIDSNKADINASKIRVLILNAPEPE